MKHDSGHFFLRVAFAGIIGAAVLGGPVFGQTDSDSHAAIIERQVAYLEYLDRADELLAKKKADEAIALLETAIALDVPDSTLSGLPVSVTSKNAAAYYALAVAYSQKQEWDAARRSLRDAGKNDYRNTAFVKNDPRLAELRAQDGFDRLLELFPSENPTDSYAGKTVADRDFGIEMQMHRKGNFPKLGEWAPNFELPLLEGGGDKKLELASLHGEKPVVLVFGSFT